MVPTGKTTLDKHGNKQYEMVVDKRHWVTTTGVRVPWPHAAVGIAPANTMTTRGCLDYTVNNVNLKKWIKKHEPQPQESAPVVVMDVVPSAPEVTIAMEKEEADITQQLIKNFKEMNLSGPALARVSAAVVEALSLQQKEGVVTAAASAPLATTGKMKSVATTATTTTTAVLVEDDISDSDL